MSGGYWDYKNDYAQDEIFKYFEHHWNALEDREISELVWDVFNLLHDFDWYKSGDTCKETYLKKKAQFKDKWLKATQSSRMRQVIDGAIEDARKELYETYGVAEEGKE